MQGVICPRCRFALSDPTEGKLPRCPRHTDTVLIPTSALAESDGDPFLGMIVGGRFAVLQLLGAGSMGTVYRARQEAMGRDVALKIVRSDRLVDAQAVGRFQQEAHATSLLTSPHTVTVFDFGEITVDGPDPHFIDGSLFLAMELLDGESLGERLKRVGRMGSDEAVKLVRHALVSLAEAHDKGVIHRDLKPDNLLLVHSPAGDEICKVLDFGIAKVLTHQGGIDALETQAGTVFGTPRYMSPEQAQGKQLDARSDLYSLGVILYHALLGHPPYTDSDAVVVMAHHIKSVPKRPSRADPDLLVPAALEDLLMRVLDKRAENRPQSAKQFIAELDALGPLSLGNATGELTAVLGQAPLGAPSKWVMLAVGGLVGLLVLAGTAVAFSGDPPQRVTAAMASAAGGVAVGAIAEAQAVAADAEAEEHAEAKGAAAGHESASAAPRAPAARKVKPKKRRYERFDE
jgi:hypothetical protein